jgi:hypothetical protein
MTTFLAVAENSKLEFTNLECNAIGTLDRVDCKYQIIGVTLHPILKITDEFMKDKAF